MESTPPILVHTPPLDITPVPPPVSPDFMSERLRAPMSAYGFDFDWYAGQIRRPTAYGVMGAIVASLGAVTLSGVWADGADAFSFFIKLAVWLGIGWRIQSRAGSARAAALAAGIAGLAIGCVLALLRLVAVREVWTVFNLIIEPVVSGVFGYCIGGAAALAAKPFHRSVHASVR
jgi:hypothetical protein